MSQEEQSLDRNVVGTGPLAVTRTFATHIGFDARNRGVILHGFALPSLGHKVVEIPHDRVHGHSLRTSGLTHSAGMAAVKLATAFLVGGKLLFILVAEFCPGQGKDPFHFVVGSQRTTDRIDLRIVEDEPDSGGSDFFRILEVMFGDELFGFVELVLEPDQSFLVQWMDLLPFLFELLDTGLEDVILGHRSGFHQGGSDIFFLAYLEHTL